MYNSIPRRALHGLNKEKCQTCSYFCEKCIEMNNRSDTPHAIRDAICWCCKKCTNGECQFIMTGRPYEGSVYNERTLTDGTKTVNVRLCPNFERG